jgi:hypothetical protein
VRDHARGLLGTSVRVYDGDGSKLLYGTDNLYLAARAEDVTIETPSEPER